MSLTPSSVSQRSAGTIGSMTVFMQISAAASNTTSCAGVGMEPSGVHSSSDSSGACPVGEASPDRSSAARISAGRRTKSKASTFFSPIAASLSREPFISAENCAASEYSWTDARGNATADLLSYIVVQGRSTSQGCAGVSLTANPPGGGFAAVDVFLLGTLDP